MRVVFLGTPEFAVPSLEALLACPDFEVVGIFTQPDRPSGRGQRLHSPPIKDCAERHGFSVHQPSRIRSEENRPLLESLEPDFLVVVAFGQILPAWLLRIPKIAPVNVHASLLPQYRGAAPVSWAIFNGESRTGVTTMIMVEELDAGPTCLQKEASIPEEMTAGELHDSLAAIGAPLLLDTLNGLANGTVNPAPQDPSLVSWAPRIKKEMAAIDWARDARSLHNQVRAFNPWPVACSTYRGRDLKIYRSRPAGTGHGPGAPGTYVGCFEEGMRILCGDQVALDLLEVQLPGRRRISGREFASGERLHPGTGILA